MSLYEEDENDETIEMTSIKSPAQLESYLKSIQPPALSVEHASSLFGSPLVVWETTKDLGAYADLYISVAQSVLPSNTVITGWKKAIIEGAKQKRVHSIRDMGIHVVDGGYAIYTIVGGVPYHKKLTNFIIQNVRHTKLIGGNFITIVDVNVKGEVHKDITLTASAITGVNEFRTAIKAGSMGTVEQDVTSKEFGLLIAHIESQNVRKLKAVPYTGYMFNADGIPYMLYNGGNGSEIIVPDGVDSPDNEYYHESNNHKSKFDYVDCEEEEWKEITRTVLDNFIFVNNKEKMMASLGWMLATPLKCLADREEYFKRDIRFPILHMAGSPGAGKTTIFKYLTSMMGYNQGGSSFTKSFTVMLSMAASNSEFVWIDEYKVDSSNKQNSSHSLLDILRKAYDSGIEERGRPDQTKVEYHLVSPIIVGGESQFSDKATLERSIVISLSGQDTNKNYRNNRHFEIMQSMKKSKLQKFAKTYHKWVLDHHTKWKEWVKEAEETVYSLKMQASERPIGNIIYLALGIIIARELANHVGANSANYNKTNVEKMCKDTIEKSMQETVTESEEYKFAHFLAENWSQSLTPTGSYGPSASIREKDEKGQYVTQVALHKTTWVERFIAHNRAHGRVYETTDVNKTVNNMLDMGVLSDKPKTVKIGGVVKSALFILVEPFSSHYGVDREIWAIESDKEDNLDITI